MDVSDLWTQRAHPADVLPDAEAKPLVSWIFLRDCHICRGIHYRNCIKRTVVMPMGLQSFEMEHQRRDTTGLCPCLVLHGTDI